MDTLSNPRQAADSRPGMRVPAAVVTIVVALVAFAIGGSAYWHPPRVERVLLPLGRATPVSLSAGPPSEVMSRVLDVVAPSVAFITIPEANRSGSGFVVHEAGFVVTNAHVVEGVRQVHVSLGSGAEYKGEVWGADPATDIGVVKVETEEELPVAALGDSDRLRVAEFVLAIGAPFGLQASATEGIVSGLHRNGLGIAAYEDFIITDAPINRGNSGGPLVNMRGEVIGVNTAIIADESAGNNHGGFAGVGFAIPINVARVVAQRLIGDGGLGAVSAVAGAADPQVDDASAMAAPAARGTNDGASRYPTDAVALVSALGADGAELLSASGFVVENANHWYVVTNEHVVRDADSVAIHLPRHRPLRAVVRLDDPGLDLAIAEILVDDPLPTLPLGSAAGLRARDEIVAIGARRGRDPIPHSGQITNTEIPAWGGMRTILIETTARTVVGDSGGPLMKAGEVVGVLVARYDAQAAAAAAAGRSYAIPIEHVLQMLAGVTSSATGGANGLRDQLGFAPLPQGGRGIIVINVVEDSAASRAGLVNGDRIVEADGKSLTGSEEEQRAWLQRLGEMEAGTEVKIVVLRSVEGRRERTRVELTYTVGGD